MMPMEPSFIGLAYNKETATESNTASDYTWGRFRGEDGTDGVPGPAGEDGKTTYTWIAYSDNSDGSDMYQIPTDSTKYIGIAVNKDTATESNDPADYTWSRFRGEDGAAGQDAVMLAIEFYMNGTRINDIPCDIHGAPISGNTVIAKLYRISGNTKEDYTPDRWRVSYLKEGVEVLFFQPLESLNFIDISLNESLAYDSIVVQALERSIPDYVLIAEKSISKVMSNVPDWLVGWDTNKVQIGSEYMISPKLFTGKNTGTAEEPVLTGIVQGDKCITIDGAERSGIFALVNNEVVFELDPENGKYEFNGKVSTSKNGKRIELDAENAAVLMYDANNNLVGEIYFGDGTDTGFDSLYSIPYMRLKCIEDQIEKAILIVSPISFVMSMDKSMLGDKHDCGLMLMPHIGLVVNRRDGTTATYG